MPQRKAPMSRGAGMQSKPAAPGKAPAPRAKLKTKQRARTEKEKAYHDRLAALGCIACMKDGHFNPHVSIHHVHGRTAPGCHMQVLPLCGPHHQDDGTALAVHPWKTRWEARYGNQDDLIIEVQKILGIKNAI